MAQVYRSLNAEAEAAVQAVAGGDAALAERLNIGNFNSLPEWTQALLEARVQQAPPKLAPEPSPSPAAPAGGTPRTWTTLAEAAEQFADGAIGAEQWELAKAWHFEGRLASGEYGE